jgi:hypothetical protein
MSRRKLRADDNLFFADMFPPGFCFFDGNEPRKTHLMPQKMNTLSNNNVAELPDWRTQGKRRVTIKRKATARDKNARNNTSQWIRRKP